MAKNSKTTKPESNTKAEAKAKEAKAAAAAVANPKVVAAIRAEDEARSNAASKLAHLLQVVQDTEVTRPELVASYLEAKPNCSPATAQSQASRIMGLLKDPEVASKLISGEITLKTAREATTKKQENPNEAKAKENKQKRLATALAQVVAAAKELGIDRTSLKAMLTEAAKKAGIK